VNWLLAKEKLISQSFVMLWHPRVNEFADERLDDHVCDEEPEASSPGKQPN